MGVIKLLNERKELFFILFLTIVSIFLSGYYFGIKDQSIQIPFAESYVDDSLYPNDITIDQASILYSVFLPLMGLLGQILPFKYLYFGLFFVLKFFLLLMVFYLTKLLFKKKSIGYIAVFLFLLNKPAFGGTTIFDDRLLGRIFVLPLIILSIYLFLKNKYLLSFFLLGISFLFHPLSGVCVFCMYSFYFLIKLCKNFRIERLKVLIKPYLVFFLTVSPLVIWRLLSPASIEVRDFNLWIYLLKLRLGHHLFPFSWYYNLLSKSSIFFVMLFLAGLLISIFILIKTFKLKPENREYHNKIVLFSLAIFILLAFGTLFIEVIRLPYVTNFLVNFQPQRSFRIFMVFFLIYFANFSYKSVLNFNKKSFIIKLIFPFTFIILFFGLKLVDKDYFLPISLFAIMFFIFYLTPVRFRFRHHILVLTLMILITTIFVISQNGFEHMDLPFVEKSSPWIDVQRWANNNTDKDDMFLVSPDKEDFRMYSKRPSFGGWNDGTFLFLNQDYGRIWWDRMKEINCTKVERVLKLSLDACEKNYHNLGTKKVLDLAEKYNISYIVYKKPNKLDLKKVYENEAFVIYSSEN